MNQTSTHHRSAPAVSVVMSVYNGERFLREAAESVLGQTFQDFEFIIVDDGSTDTSPLTLDAYAKRDQRLRTLRQENRGLVEALNLGCSLARGKYIARMDADDIALRERLMRQVDFMEKHPDVGVVGSAIEVINGGGDSVAVHRYPTNHGEITRGLRKGDCPLVHPTVLIRRQVLDAVGGYRKAMVDAEDYDLWLRIAARSQLANLDAVLLKYRRHANQVSIQRARQQALSNLAARVDAAAMNGDTGGRRWEGSVHANPASLADIGISDAIQNAAITRGYVTSICSMYEAREYAIASTMIKQVVRSAEWKHADTSVVADLLLLEARLHWRQRRFAMSFVSAGRAVLTRPAILARPIKPAIGRLGLGRSARRSYGVDRSY